MQAHVMAHFIEDPKPIFPFLCLTASGGHIQIVLVEDYLKTKVIGQTRDDAAGEAFDKGARILGLTYPGGPEIEKLALDGDYKSINFPRALIEKNNFEFSFSGLKTSLLYYFEKNNKGLTKSPIFLG